MPTLRGWCMTSIQQFAIQSQPRWPNRAINDPTHAQNHTRGSRQAAARRCIRPVIDRVLRCLLCSPECHLQRAQPPESAGPRRSLARLSAPSPQSVELRECVAPPARHAPSASSEAPLPACPARADCAVPPRWTGCTHQEEPLHLTNVSGHLPDLDFSLIADDGKPVTGQSLQGRYGARVLRLHALPGRLSRNHGAPDASPSSKLGPDAQKVRILFITVDPVRDTPKALHDYVGAFDAQHAVGLTGSDEIETLARKIASPIRWKSATRTAITMSRTAPPSTSSMHRATRGCSPPAAIRPTSIADDLRRIIDNPA